MKCFIFATLLFPVGSSTLQGVRKAGVVKATPGLRVCKETRNISQMCPSVGAENPSHRALTGLISPGLDLVKPCLVVPSVRVESGLRTSTV